MQAKRRAGDSLSQNGGGSIQDSQSPYGRGGGQLARVQERRLVVNVCGRTLTMTDPCHSLMDLQATLQDELGMPDQAFEVFDSTGARLLVDMDLREAVEEIRTPLSATLSDASIHFIENRREELAQMQWKLVRDQHNQAAMKLGLVTRQVSDVEAKLERQQRSMEQSLQVLRGELYSALEASKEVNRNENRQISEKIAGVGQLLQAERNMREVTVEQMNKSIQNVHDSIDANRESIQQAAAGAMAHIDSTKRLIEAERSAREALEDKQARDLEAVLERVEEFQSSLRSAMGEYSRRFERASADFGDSAEQQTRSTHKIRTEVDAVLEGQASRMKLLEERSATLEARIDDAARRHADTVERLSQRHDKVSTNLEQVKFHGSASNSTLETMARKIEELESALRKAEQDFREQTMRERQQRVDEFKSLKQAIGSDQERLRHNIAADVDRRLGGETEARQDALRNVLDTVSNSLGTNLGANNGTRSKSNSHGPPIEDITSEFVEAITPGSKAASVAGSTNLSLPIPFSDRQGSGCLTAATPGRQSGSLLAAPVERQSGSFLAAPMERPARSVSPTIYAQSQVRQTSPLSRAIVKTAPPISGGSYPLPPGVPSIQRAQSMTAPFTHVAPPRVAVATAPKTVRR